MHTLPYLAVRETGEVLFPPPRNVLACLDTRSTRAVQRVTLPPLSAAIDECRSPNRRNSSRKPTTRTHRKTEMIPDVAHSGASKYHKFWVAGTVIAAISGGKTNGS